MASFARWKPFGSNYDLVTAGWETKENNDGVVYFVNKEFKMTSWIHPYVNSVFEELAQYNDVKYAAYRTALKLRLLQVKLGLSWICIKSIKAVFSELPSGVESNGDEDYASCRELFCHVHDILEKSDALRLHQNYLIRASEIISNLILELYDSNRTGKLTYRSIRIALVALCSAKLSEKYRQFFNEITDNQGHVKREKFLYLIHDLMQIPELLRESTAFGTNVSAAVNSCFKNDVEELPGGTYQDLFYSWLLQEPQTLIWLPTLHRAIATENIQHSVQCSVCSTHPIVGFRYRCLQCLSYDLCQSCFFRGCISQGHRLKHPMQEYCLPTTAKQDTKALLKIVRNKFSRKHRQSKIKFLPVDDDSITGSVFQWQPRSLVPIPRNSFSNSTDSGLAIGSGGDDFQAIPSPDHSEGEKVSIMRWSKSLEVLGEPCDTSSPCLQQENISKKSMEMQQIKMAETIQLLQDENRVLKQRLTALQRRETEDDNEKICVAEESITVRVEKNLYSDPLKEITTDTPISPIKLNQVNGQLASSNVDIGEGKQDREISVDVLDIVGSCTPIPRSFCVEGKGSTDGDESGINEECVSSNSVSASSEVPDNHLQEVNVSLTPLEEGTNDEDNKPPQNPVLVLDPLTDTETESTCNDLEYTYSDMSIKSEASSRAASMKRGQVQFPMEHLSVENIQDKEQQSKYEGSRDTRSSPNSVGSGTLSSSRNDTLDLDAFRLCRMKFDAADKTPRVLERQGSSSSPVGFVGQSKQMEYTNRNHKSCYSQANEVRESGKHLHMTSYASLDLSEIPVQLSTASLTLEDKLTCAAKPQPVGKTKKMEPVFMSTPVADQTSFLPHKNASTKRSASAKIIRKRSEKENRFPSTSEKSSQDVYFGKKASTPGITPKSSIPPWQRHRILRSVDGLYSNKSYSCNDLTTEGEMGMTTMFDRAEHHKTLGMGAKSLAVEDKEELKRMIEKLGDSTCSDLPAGVDLSNSSMLQAVLNVGDAMADFVQATADAQMQKESTHL